MRRAVRPLLLATVVILAGVVPLLAQASPPSSPGGQPAYPTTDGLGRPWPSVMFYCQYLGLAHDASGKYPLYQNAMFTMATDPGAVQRAWQRFIEGTYHPSSPGNPMCAIIPEDPVEREGVLKSVDLLTQPATQVVVKTAWKP